MTLYERIQAELKQAMKDKDSVKMNTLRAVVAAAKKLPCVFREGT